jgi:phosphoglycolate phosphatase-like HAD superfamily hydrolase
VINRGIIALDADGVLLDYGYAYAGAWAKAFGERPAERDPNAYWPIGRWQVSRLEGAALTRFSEAFDELFWSSIPAIPGALEACKVLSQAGYELVCVTALPDKFAKARRDNLLALSFPIEVVHTAPHASAEISPKAEILKKLQPVVFVDDYLPYFAGLSPEIHRALILRGANGSPNSGELLRWVDSQHADLQAFAAWWVGRAH